MKETDKKVRGLFDLVQEKKRAIAKIEKPNWKTNCCFSYDSTRVDANVNIATVRTVEEVLKMAAFLFAQRQSFEQVQEFFSTNVKFKWGGYSYDDWMYDFKARIDKIQIAKKRKELEVLESRLDAILSPELKAEMEIEAIEKELQS